MCHQIRIETRQTQTNLVPSVRELGWQSISWNNYTEKRKLKEI